MDKIEELLRKSMLKGKKLERTSDCPKESVLAGYLGASLNKEEKEKTGAHLSKCLYCLEQLNLAYEGQKQFLKVNLPLAEQKIIEKAKKIALLSSSKSKRKGNIWLIATIISFALSFIVPRYFLQFLAAAVILGLKWVFESDTARSLIMILDKRHKEKEEEDLPERVKDRLNK